jgi:GT2 family glycosyltransferase
MSEIDLSVVIVSWNVADLVVACLESLFAAATGLMVEVIVVDNDSVDMTVHQIRTKFPNVTVITNNYNAGFAAATNQGLHMCRGRHALLLNPDTILKEDALRIMVNFADKNPHIGLLGPKVLLPSGEIQKACAGSLPKPLDWFWYYSLIGQVFRRSKIFGKLYLSYWDHQTSRSVDFLAGAAMLIPRQTLKKVGLLDETHPMYLEDIDYCFRVRQVGKAVYYLAEATVVHYLGQSSKQVPSETKILMLEALALFFKRYGRPWDPLLFRLAAVSIIPIRLPVLAMVKLGSCFRSIDSAAVKRIRLRSELVTLFWGLGFLRSPDIRKITLRTVPATDFEKPGSVVPKE